MPRMTRQQFQFLLAQLQAPKLASPVQPYQQPGVGIPAMPGPPGPDPRFAVPPPLAAPPVQQSLNLPTDLSGYGSLLSAIGPSAFQGAGRVAQARPKPRPFRTITPPQHRAYTARSAVTKALGTRPRPDRFALPQRAALPSY